VQHEKDCVLHKIEYVQSLIDNIKSMESESGESPYICMGTHSI